MFRTLNELVSFSGGRNLLKSQASILAFLGPSLACMTYLFSAD